jgi:hypothetical protein
MLLMESTQDMIIMPILYNSVYLPDIPADKKKDLVMVLVPNHI